MNYPRTPQTRDLDAQMLGINLRAVTGLEVAILALTLVISTAFYMARGYDAVAWVSPPSILFSMACFNWTMIKRTVDFLWTPLFAFRTASAVFFGFGGILSENLGPEAQALYFAELPYTSDEAAKVFLVWHLGVFLTILGCFLAERFGTSRPESGAKISPRVHQPFYLGAAFTAAGLGYAYLIRLPSELGALPIGIIPQAISLPFDAALAVGIFLLTLWALERRGVALLIIPPIVLLSSAIGLFLLTKQGVLLPLIFCALAFLMKRFTFARAASVVTILTILLGVLQPMVAYGRDIARPGDVVDPAERISDLASFFATDRAGGASNSQADFLRLGHTHVAAFIVGRYDAGLPSDSLKGSLTALVPRVIWPNKPIITDEASDLYYTVSGRTGSALATTVFADLYWNAGWLGLAVISFAWGSLMWVGTRLSYAIVHQRDWYMMPFVLLCFMMGISQESSFVSAIFVPTFMAIIAYHLLRIVRSLASKPNNPSHRL